MLHSVRTVGQIKISSTLDTFSGSDIDYIILGHEVLACGTDQDGYGLLCQAMVWFGLVPLLVIVWYLLRGTYPCMCTVLSSTEMIITYHSDTDISV